MDGAQWLDISDFKGKFDSIIEARLDLAVQKGCDGVEVTHLDGYMHNSGFYLNAGYQLTYN